MNTVKQESQSYRRQSGIATILTVVLIGIAMTALALQYLSTVRSTQDTFVTAHSVTHAQNGLWTGVEAFRMYLDTLTNAQITALGGEASIPIALPGGFGSMNLYNIVVSEIGGNKFRVEAELVNVHGDARSAAGLNIVYEIDPDACENCVARTASLDFNDDLNIKGGIVFRMPEGGLPVINVNGNIVVDSVDVTPLGRLNSTKSITLGSQVRAEEVYANGDVTINGSARVDKVWAIGNVTTDGGAVVRNIWANGHVNSNASNPTDSVNTRSNVRLTSGSYGLVKAGGTAFVSTSGGVDELQAVGDIEFTSWGTLTTLLGEGALKCVADNFDKFTSFKITGAATNCPATTQTGQTVDVQVMEELKPYTAPESVVDVWSLKSYANYVIEYDLAASKTKVTLYHIDGIADGTSYYLGDGPDGMHNSHLCVAFTGKKGECSELLLPKIAMCLGYSRQNTCMTYSTRNGGWIISGSSSAPGIMWFDGNVELASGTNYTTILATGHVTTSGALKSYSANYAGYDEICEALGTGIDPDILTVYQTYFSKQAPTNLCVNGTYSPIDVGNIAIAAGGFDPAGRGQYSGGNITLSALNELFGTVLSGNILTTQGDTTVHGYVSAAVLGGVGVGDNELGGKTTIDLMDLPDTFDPGRVPLMSAPCEVNCVSMGTQKKTKLLWSRYL